MKIQIDKKVLLRLINISQRAISNRTTMQILTGILFEAKNNILTLTSTDLEMSIKTSMPCIVEREGSIVIDSSVIGNIVRKLSDSIVEINVVDNKITLKCANSLFNLLGYDASEYPSLPEYDAGENLSLYGNILKDAIRQTVFAVSTDETKESVTGVHMNAKKDYIDFVSVDGFRLALKRVKIDNKEPVSITVPSRPLNELSKIIEDDQEIKLSIIPGNIVFSMEDTVVFSRLIEGNFIDYEAVIAKNFSTTLVVNRREIENSLERASLLAREERANLVKLNLSQHEMTISSNTELGNAKEDIAIDLEGKDLKIAFNARYMIEGIKVMDSEEINLNFNDNLNPCIIHPIDEDTDYTYLVLPVRVAGDM